MTRRRKDDRNVIPLKAWRRKSRRRNWMPQPSTIGLLLVGSALLFAVYLTLEQRQPGWYAHLRGNVGLSTAQPRVLRGGDAMGGGSRSTAIASARGALQGRVTHVRDGDTIEVAGKPIRIASLDCAESGTLAGEAATRRMTGLVAGQQMSCNLTGARSYDRWIGSCRLSDGRDIAEVMIGSGVCRRWR